MKTQRKFYMQFCAAVVACAVFSTTASAADLILLTGISPSTKDGDQVQLRESGVGGCSYVGTFHDTSHSASSFAEKILVAGGERLTDWSIELTQKRCDRISASIRAVLPLSTEHRYVDADGHSWLGYAAGDRVATTTPVHPPAH